MAVRSSPPKATLFCPECPHRSHLAADWKRVPTERGVRLVCPDCETTVTTRRGQPAAPERRA